MCTGGGRVRSWHQSTAWASAHSTRGVMGFLPKVRREGKNKVVTGWLGVMLAHSVRGQGVGYALHLPHAVDWLHL